MLKRLLLALFPLLIAAAVPAWDASPWLADLAQMRAAIDRDYPNRDWLIGEREVSLDRWFDRAAAAIRASGDDASARRALDRLVERFHDGHVALRWPDPPSAAPAAAERPARATVASFCAARGYDASQATPGTAIAIPGYRAIDGGGPFAAGVVVAGGTTVGVVRIGVFAPQGYPALCEAAVAAERIAPNRPCDEACDDRLATHAYATMTRGLMTTLERLRSAGADVLLVDLARNGGGSEWAEAAARTMTRRPLRAAPLGFIRSAAWQAKWAKLAATLRREAKTDRADRTILLDLAQRADVAAANVAPCPRAACSRLGRAGYASGLIDTAPASRFAGKRWTTDIFSAAQFPYRDGVWDGPVIALVDDETWSAAEEFAALLRDNGAAIVMGTRTGGAGCGHIDGGAPVVLANSKAVFEMPNCVRFRADGSNEVSGVIPDVSTGARYSDGAAFAGRLTAAKLSEAVAQAKAMNAR